LDFHRFLLKETGLDVLTLPVIIRIELLSKGKNASDTLSWKVAANLRRSEFGLRWNPVIEAASGISDDIDFQMRILTPAH
jgi:hypothetical protein